ncbi:ABC transporter permease subunit [Methanogenium cariaci]|jgi:ABC-2 type transport system permease protein
MTADRVILIAKKEFHDHITSRRYIALLVLLLIITGGDVCSEFDIYNMELADYSISGSTAMDEDGNINTGLAEYRPAPINLFGGIMRGLASSVFGALIAIAIGFDAITKERESGSIKSLFSHPVYRDEVINGKAIGGILALALAVTTVFVITVAILLINSIVPGLDEWPGIFLLWFVSVLFLVSCFAMAIMTSVFARTSGMSLVYALIIFFAFAYLAPAIAPSVSGYILGPDPMADMRDDISYEDYELLVEETKGYYMNEWEITNIINHLSIKHNYGQIGSAITNPFFLWNRGVKNGYRLDYAEMGISFEDFMGKVGSNILMMFIYPAVFFGISYVRFMRMDLR